MPILNKLYGGDGTEYDIGGGDATVIENIAKGNNLLNPDYVHPANYQYSLEDGKTKVSSSGATITDAFTYIPNAEEVYIICKSVYAQTLSRLFCYHNDAYLGYVSFDMQTTLQKVKLKPTTNYIRLFCNKPTVVTDNFCISLSPLEAFESYVGIDKIQRTLVPLMAKNDNTYSDMYGENILLFGDSIPAYDAAPYDTATLISNIIGVPVHNCAVGGATMGDRNYPGTEDYNAWSMWRLTDAIVSGDWSYQEAHLNAHGYCAEILDFLKHTDFSKVDSILIMYGYNDGTIDNQQDPLDINSLGGALRYSIETLLTAYPQIKIYPCSLTFNLDGNTRDIDKCNKIEEIATEYHLKFIDNFNIGINSSNKSFYFNAYDGVHPNVNGRKLVARNVAKEML